MNEWAWIHAAVGGVASFIFLFQTFGTAGGGADADFDADADLDGQGAEGAHGLSDYLSVRNFVAFFIGYGWVTLAALLSGASRVTASAFGAAAGVIFVFVSLVLIRTFLKFQEDGSLKLESLVGRHASVYIRIGENASSAGKVLVDTAKGRMELPAWTRDAAALAPGRMVRVTAAEGGILWVTAE